MGSLEVLLSNDSPVAGFQFDITGLTIMGASGGSAEMAGLLAEKNFNEWVLENPYALEPNYISPFELGPIK